MAKTIITIGKADKTGAIMWSETRNDDSLAIGELIQLALSSGANKITAEQKDNKIIWAVGYENET
jgi:hypothetical protein